jgi:membrane fusion protein, copper/silver efflux system
MKSGNPIVGLLCLAVAGYLTTAADLSLAQNHSGTTQKQSGSDKSGPVERQVAKPVVEAVQDVPQVEMSSAQQKLIGIKTVKVDLRPMQKVILTVGRIEADEHRLATVNTKIEGWVEKLYVDTTGTSIRKGEPLAEIYSPELVATQQELLNALQWTKEFKADTGKSQETTSELSRLFKKDAASMLEASRRRLHLWDISDQQIRQIEASGKTIRTLTLYSPVNGFVMQKMAMAGMKVMPGEKLYDVADLSDIWVIADIYEYELPLIRVGNQATITLAYLPGKQFLSKIDYIYPSIAPDTRTVKIRLKLNNSDNQLKPQMFANVEIKINLGSKLMIPEASVIDTGRGMVVYVDLGNDAFEPREIKTGLKTEGYIEVLRGLKRGEKVVSSANFLVDSEAQLKGIKPLPRK